jgi:hypothetical protein
MQLAPLVGDSVQIKETMYWPFLLSPAIFLVRFMQRVRMFLHKNLQAMSDVKLPHPLLNKVFYRATSWENKRMGYKPWGSSVFVVMRKKA